MTDSQQKRLDQFAGNVASHGVHPDFIKHTELPDGRVAFQYERVTGYIGKHGGVKIAPIVLSVSVPLCPYCSGEVHTSNGGLAECTNCGQYLSDNDIVYSDSEKPEHAEIIQKYEATA